MATYGDMQARIADETRRSNLALQIKLAIQSAIAYYALQRFYFNELKGQNFSTVVGQEYYGAADLADIPNMVKIETLTLIQPGGYRYVLDPQAFDTIEEWVTSGSMQSDPTDYAYYGQQIRLYPVPNRVLTVSAAYQGILSTLMADADSNAWTNDAEALIRARAKADLYSNVVKAEDLAALAQAEEQQQLLNLKGATLSRKTPTRLRGSGW